MFRKNVAVTGLAFGFVSITDGAPVITGSPLGFIVKDGGAQAALTNGISHLGNGVWAVDLTQAEMNADIIALAFILSGALPVYFTIRTVPELGPPVDVNAVTGSTTRATRLAGGLDTEATGAIVGGSTPTVFNTNLTESTTNHYNGRSIGFRTGALAGQAMPIIGYNGSTKAITVTNLTNDIPASGDTFAIF